MREWFGFHVCFSAFLLAAASCSDDNAAPNAPAGPAESYVIEAPAAGQTLITGTTRRVAWRGGDPAEKVDIRFLPKSGDPVPLATGVDNTGALEVNVQLLADHLRGGGAVEIVSAGASLPPGTTPPGPAQGEGGRRVPVRVGSMAGFSWNGTAEEYYWLDVTTGAKQLVGTVGDLTTWATKTVAVDYDSELIYVIGFSGDEQKLYVLDAKSGALVRSVPLSRDGAANRDQSSYLGVTFARDALLAFTWDAAAAVERLVRVDTVTGATRVMGSVGDLQAWNGEVAYAAATDSIYVLGASESATGAMGEIVLQNKLYELDGSSGALRASHVLVDQGQALSSPLGNVLGLNVSAPGRLIGFRWNGAAEDMVAIDPATGETSVAGVVGDLAVWTGVGRIDATTNLVYVLGDDAQNAHKIYTLDALTGALLSTTSAAELPTNGVLVY